MASVELSAGIMSELPARIISPVLTFIGSATNGVVLYNFSPLLPYLVSDAYPTTITGFINIYKGTVPVDFSTLTSATSRSADILISIATASTTNFYLTYQITSNPAVINSAYVLASSSGTATWFRWYTALSSNVIHQIIGTVGATGSGADLEIPNTSIVSGQPYRIQNLRLQFPSSWTY